MAMRATCPACEREYRLKDEYAGATVRCRECGETFAVDDDGAGVADTSLKRASPGLALGLLVGSFVLILGFCIGLPVGALLLFGKRDTLRQHAAAPRQTSATAPKQQAAADNKAKDEPQKTKAAEKQASEYVKELDDADPKVRGAALKALAKLKDESSIPAIARRLTDARDRRAASDALKTFGASAESEVVKYLQEEDKAVRIEACRILNKIGTKASVPALQQTAQAKEKDVSKEAQNAIKEIGKRSS
jgi:predicted Zn finger-like uncharacterized protein